MIKKISALFLSIILCLTFVGCSASKAENVYNIEGENIWSGLYLYYSITSVNEAITKINEAEKAAGKEAIDDSKWTEYKIEDKDAMTWVREKTLQECKNYVIVNKKFEEYGLTVSEEIQKSSKQFNDYIWQILGETYASNGVSIETFKKVTESRDKRQEVFLKYYGKDGAEPISDDELKAKFMDNYSKIKRVPFDMTNADGSAMSEEQKVEFKTLLEGYVASVAKGTSLDEIKKQYAEKLASEKGETATEETTAIDFEVVKKDSLSDKIKEILGTVTFEQPVLIEDGTKFIIAIPYDLTNDTESFEKHKNEILSDLKTEDFSKKMVEWSQDYVVKTDEKLYKKYNPKNIKLTQ